MHTCIQTPEEAGPTESTRDHGCKQRLVTLLAWSRKLHKNLSDALAAMSDQPASKSVSNQERAHARAKQDLRAHEQSFHAARHHTPLAVLSLSKSLVGLLEEVCGTHCRVSAGTGNHNSDP